MCVCVCVCVCVYVYLYIYICCRESEDYKRNLVFFLPLRDGENLKLEI